MARIYELDHFTKGTGASVSPLDEEADPERRVPLKGVKLGGEPAREPKKRMPGAKTSTPLAPGHVRKKATGEIGKVKALDSRAGTVTVLWLRQGRTSTVPIDSVTRR
jgi:hypothetical protein